VTQPNLRFTPQRKVILEELQQLTSHPTADDLYERVRGRMPKISLGTIYRNLDILYHQGVIQKLHVAESQMRFDGNPEPHFHVHCVKCGRIADIYNCPDISFVLKEVQSDFSIEDYSLIFHGHCPECAS